MCVCVCLHLHLYVFVCMCLSSSYICVCLHVYLQPFLGRRGTNPEDQSKLVCEASCVCVDKAATVDKVLFNQLWADFCYVFVCVHVRVCLHPVLHP